MSAKILAIGNEGFQIATDEVVILVDAFYHTAAWVGSAPAVRATDIKAADLILVTHAHPDHFNETEVAAVADRTGATVVGPATVVSRLRGKVDVGKLVELEPSLATGGERAAAKTLVLPAAQVTVSPPTAPEPPVSPGGKTFPSSSSTSRRRAA